MDFFEEDHLALSAHGLPTKVEVAPIVGETVAHFLLDDLRGWRFQQIEFELARRLARIRRCPMACRSVTGTGEGIGQPGEGLGEGGLPG